MQRRAGAASADLFGGQNPEPRARAEAAPRAENGDLFGGPTMRDRVDAAARAKDAERNGENADRVSDKGTLFDKPEPAAPEQTEVPGGGASELPAVRETFATQKEAGLFAANLKGDARVHKTVGKDGKPAWVVERKAGKPEPLLARGEPAGESRLGVEKVQAVARGVLGKNSAHVPVDVVASLKDLPEKPRKAVEDEGVKDGDIKAFHYDGRSYILADQMHSERDQNQSSAWEGRTGFSSIGMPSTLALKGTHWQRSCQRSRGERAGEASEKPNRQAFPNCRRKTRANRTDAPPCAECFFFGDQKS